MIIIVQGAMWAGKTTELVQLANSSPKPLGIDCCNSRGTKRELSNLISSFPFTKETKSEEFEIFVDKFKPTLVLIDEFHLAQVFGKEKEIFEIIALCVLRGVDIAVCGLLFDFYNDYKPFEIWHELDMFIEQQEIQAIHKWKKSLIPCASCGTNSDVVLTRRRPEGDSNNRVGDDYENVCVCCGIRNLARIRDFLLSKEMVKTLGQSKWRKGDQV